MKSSTNQYDVRGSVTAQGAKFQNGPNTGFWLNEYICVINVDEDSAHVGVAYHPNGQLLPSIQSFMNTTQGFYTTGNLTAGGTKSRIVPADEFGKRLLYCYETPSPMFGDVGEGVIDESGLCYVFLDPVFAETISTNQYQVFLQKYGQGDCFVLERKPDYFVVQGEPGLAFGWELKAKQKDFDQMRLEKPQEELKKGINYGEQGSSYYINLEEGRISA